MFQHDKDGMTAEGIDCAPSSASGGHYIMYATASDGLEPDNDLFSQCSKDWMGAIIVARGPVCFTSACLRPMHT